MLQKLNDANIKALEFNKCVAPFINDIATPLRELSIHHFGYARIFNDSTILRLSDNAAWSQKFFENHFYNDVDLFGLEQIPLETIHYKVLTGTPENEHYKALFDHGFWYGLVIYKRTANYCNLWFFSSSNQNPLIIDFYINNIDIFKKYILYFQTKAHNLIYDNDPSRLISINAYKNKKIEIVDNKHIDLFSKNIEIKKYIFDENIQLSKRELECVSYLLKGLSAKEIGKTLGLSHRTVESYLESVKNKLNCTNNTLRNFFCEKTLNFSFDHLINLL